MVEIEDKKILPRKIPTQERSKKKIDKLLNSTIKLLESRGLENITTDIIAEEAGISVGSLYQFFPNKTAVVYSLAERQFQNLHDTFLNLVPPKEVIKNKEIKFLVKSFVEGFVKVFIKSPDYIIVMRAIQATPELREVELKTKLKFYQSLSEKVLKPLFPTIPSQKLEIVCELIVESVYVVLVRLLQENRSNRGKKLLLKELELMLINYIEVALIKKNKLKQG